MLRHLIITLTIALTCGNCLAQWTMRPSFYNIADVEEYGGRVVAFAPHAVFVADYSGDVDIYSKTSRLSGADISAGYADKGGQCFIVGYANGSADMVSGSSTATIQDISSGNYLYDRRISHITSSKDFYILSGQFGISFVKKDFSGVYGVCHTDNPVLMTAADGNRLWAVTADEILSADLASVNLQSPENYTKKAFTLPSGYVFTGVTSANGAVYVSAFSSSQNKSALYALNDNTLIDEFDGAISLKSNGSNIIVSAKGSVNVYNSSSLLIKQISAANIQENIDITAATILENGMLAVATKKSGMFFGNEGAFKKYLPNGPYTDRFNDLKTVKNRLVAGGKAISILDNNVWNTSIPTGGESVTSLFFNPFNYHHLFAGAEKAVLYQYDDANQKSALNVESAPKNRIAGMSATPDGSLLVVVDGGGIFILSSDGSWHYLSSSEQIKNHTVKSITQVSDYIFLLNLGTSGLFAIDLNATPTDAADDRTRLFYPQFSSGEKVGTEVTSVAKDLDSRIWIGSNSGIGYMQNSDGLLSGEARCMRPVVTQSSKTDGDYSQYLLRYACINDICADAADRKWIATNAGVFAVSDDGTGEVFCFNTKNSPLPSDTVFSARFMGLTGELFFATSSGLCSYAGDVEDAWQDLESVKVYPNPVRPDYDGMIYVSGLEDETDVRITDISGALVYHTVSAGGKITWDGRNLRGHRCHTGIYLIFCVNPETRDTTVKKLLIVN